MENNFDKKASSRELQMEAFSKKLPIWREQFGDDFAYSMNVLCTEIPTEEQSHYLFGEKKEDNKGAFFLGELATFDSSWVSVVERLRVISLMLEGKGNYDNTVHDGVDFFKLASQKLLLLNTLLPQSNFVKNVEGALKNKAAKVPVGSQQLYELDSHLQNTFIMMQALLVGNWAYWAEQKNLRKEGEGWKKSLFDKYNSPYILKLLSRYLTEKIVGIGKFFSVTDVGDWREICQEHAFYFNGYDKGSNQFFQDNYKAYLSPGGYGMCLNPFASKFHGNYLENFILHIEKQGEKGVVYDPYQLELLHVFANMIATHDHRNYPIVELPVTGMFYKYDLEKVFNFKIY